MQKETVTLKWVGGQNGHWMIYVNGTFVVSCDDGELSTELRDL